MSARNMMSVRIERQKTCLNPMAGHGNATFYGWAFVAYEHMLDFVRDNETIEDDNGKYLDVVEHIAKDIYEHTDIDDNSDFSATDVACAIMNEATIHYWYWEEPEY